MQKVIENLIKVFESVIEAVMHSPKFRTFYWETAGSFVALLMGTIAMIRPDELDLVTTGIMSLSTAGLLRLTEYINKNK